MKALKILVISMGLLIVIGIGLVGYGLTRGKQATVAIPGAAESPAVAFATRYPLPRGARLEQASAAGDRILLRLSGPDGDQLVLLDSHTGKLAGTITLTQDGK